LIENHADLARAMAEANQPDVVLFLNSHDICEYGANATAAARFAPRLIDNVRPVPGSGRGGCAVKPQVKRTINAKSRKLTRFAIEGFGIWRR
jgi:hypothetical protein